MQAALRPTWVSVANTSLYPTGAFGVWGSGRTGSMAAIGGKESVHKVGATAVVLSICPAGRPMIMCIIALTMWCCMHDTQLVSARHDLAEFGLNMRLGMYLERFAGPNAMGQMQSGHSRPGSARQSQQGRVVPVVTYTACLKFCCLSLRGKNGVCCYAFCVTLVHHHLNKYGLIVVSR